MAHCVIGPSERLMIAEDRDEYLADNVFWVPKQARWSHLQANAKQTDIGKLVDDAMLAIEANNPSLKGELHIPIPPLSVQEDIATVICALDDKIDLNRRMNETLEAMARAIFKDWFVDFGPRQGRGPPATGARARDRGAVPGCAG